MDVKYQIPSENEVDLKEIILLLWKNKFLILVITLTFMIAGFYYGIKKTKVYQTAIFLQDAQPIVFNKYVLHNFQKEDAQSLATIFNEEYKLNLLSLSYLQDFLEQSENLDKFKSLIKEDNIDPNFFISEKKLHLAKNKNSESFHELQLNYTKPFPAKLFLRDYATFVKKKTEEKFKINLINDLESQINIYEKNLDFAKKIEQYNPMSNSITVNDPSLLFSRGTKILFWQINNLKSYLIDLENFKLKYNFIFGEANEEYVISKSLTFFCIVAFILGVFFSFIIVYLKVILINIKKL